MKIDLLKNIGLAVVAGLFLGGCGDSAGDPETIDQTDLNPPGALVSVTDSEKIELRWTTGNGEKNFKGYYVFATKSSLAELASHVKYPEGADTSAGVSIPRCSDNNEFFTAFGFTVTDAKCDSSLFSGSKASGSPTAEEEREAEEAEDKEILRNFVPCAESDAGAKLSLAVTPPAVSLQKCTITQAWNTETKGLEALKNGESYTFFVMAVAGDDLDEVSWSSNIIEDVPSQTSLATQNLEIPAGRYVALGWNTDAASAEFLSARVNDNDGAAFPCPGGSTNTPCWLTSGNTESLEGIYLARDNVNAAYKQRIFVSTQSDGPWRIQPVPLRKDTDATDDRNIYLRIPGDQATTDSASAPYPEAGTTFTVYDHKLFDLVYTASDGNRYYGKLIVTDLGYDGDNATGAATIEATVVMQPKANDTHYLF